MKTTGFLLVALCICQVALAQSTWYPISSGTDKKLNTLDFPSENVGYIGGNDSLLLKTIDGGETWNPVTYSGVTFYPGGEHIVELDFVSETVGYMTVGPYSGVYKTTNGGTTWAAVTTSGNLCFNEGLYFFDEQNGFIGGSGCFQGELIDRMSAGTISPATLNDPTSLPDNRIVDIDFLNSNYGLAVSKSGYVFRTTDGGANWDSIPGNAGADVPLTSVSIVDDTLAFIGYNASGSGFGILMSTDAGVTWNMDMSSATFYYPAFLSVHTSDAGTTYSGAQPAFGNTGLIFERDDLWGWSFMEVDHPINDMSSYGDSVVFGVGDSGYVVVNQPLGILGLDQQTETAPSFSVYPNPVQDQLYIRAVDMTSSPLVTITSLSGQVIRQEQTQDQILNVAELPAGIYLITLTSDGRVNTQRFIKQ